MLATYRSDGPQMADEPPFPGSDTPAERARRGLRRTAARAGSVARWAIAVVRIARPVVRTAAQALLALVIVFEEWGWRPLAALLAQLARLKPLAALEARIVRLPPYAALVVFAAPSILILPLKLVALWLIAAGHAVSATLLFLGAKVVGTALVARIFQLTQPALMQLGWFARAYHTFMPWKESLTAWVRSSAVWRYGRLVKRNLKQQFHAALLRVRPQLAAALARIRSAVAAWRAR